MIPNDNIVTAIEQKYDVRAIESEAKGLFYLEDDDTKHIGILVVRDETPCSVVLTKAQAYALAKEFQEVCHVRFGG